MLYALFDLPSKTNRGAAKCVFPRLPAQPTNKIVAKLNIHLNHHADTDTTQPAIP